MIRIKKNAGSKHNKVNSYFFKHDLLLKTIRMRNQYYIKKDPYKLQNDKIKTLS